MLKSCCVALLALAPSVLCAQADPIGGPFVITESTTKLADAPQIAALTGGRFVVVWALSIYNEEGGIDSSSIKARLYNSDASPVGAEFAVGANMPNQCCHPFPPSIAALADGGFVITWVAPAGPHNIQISGLRYDATGAPVGGVFRVDTTLSQPFYYMKVVSLGSGGFAVVWQTKRTATEWIPVVQVFSAQGSKLGSEIRVNDSGSLYCALDAAAVPGVGFVVTWGAVGADAFAQRLNNSGTKIGGPFSVATNVDTSCAQIAPLARGGFVSVWQTYDTSAHTITAKLQRFTTNGLHAGNPLTVYTTSDSLDAWRNLFGIAPFPDGTFLLSWNIQGPNVSGVYGRRFGLTGQPTGGAFEVDPTPGQGKGSADVAPLGTGRFVFAWRETENRPYCDTYKTCSKLIGQFYGQ